MGKIEKLYAFTYRPQGAEKDVVPNGWAVYDPMREWRRQGVGDPDKRSNWRISTINKDYQFSPTYPALLPVPAGISDNTLNYAANAPNGTIKLYKDMGHFDIYVGDAFDQATGDYCDFLRAKL